MQPCPPQQASQTFRRYVGRLQYCITAREAWTTAAGNPRNGLGRPFPKMAPAGSVHFQFTSIKSAPVELLGPFRANRTRRGVRKCYFFLCRDFGEWSVTLPYGVWFHNGTKWLPFRNRKWFLFTERIKSLTSETKLSALWPEKFNTFLTTENFSILKFTPSFQKQNMPLSNAFHVQLTNSLRFFWLVSFEKKKLSQPSRE